VETLERLVQLVKKRRRDILKELPPDSLAEYRRLGRLVKQMYAEAIRLGMAHMRERSAELHLPNEKPATPAVKPGDKSKRQGLNLEGQLANKRTPLYKHKRMLMTWLRQHGPQTRAELIRHTRIPEGSISRILQDNEFVQLAHGLWGLRGQEEKPKKQDEPKRSQK